MWPWHVILHFFPDSFCAGSAEPPQPPAAMSQAQYFRSKHGHITAWTRSKRSISETSKQPHISETWPPHNSNSLNAGRRSNSEANMATTERKPWQSQFLTSKHGHLTA